MTGMGIEEHTHLAGGLHQTGMGIEEHTHLAGVVCIGTKQPGVQCPSGLVQRKESLLTTVLSQ